MRCKLTEIVRRELVRCLFEYEWIKFPNIVKNLEKKDPLFRIGMRFHAAMVNFDRVATKKILEEETLGKDWLFNFLISLVYLSNGNMPIKKSYFDQTKQTGPDWVKHWLLFDCLIRKKEISDAFKYINGFFEKEEWVYAAILHALASSNAEQKIIREISKFKLVNECIAQRKIKMLVFGPNGKPVPPRCLAYAGEFFLRNGKILNATRAFALACQHKEVRVNHIPNIMSNAISCKEKVNIDELVNLVGQIFQPHPSNYFAPSLKTYALIKLWESGDVQNAIYTAGELVDFSKLDIEKLNISPFVYNSYVFARYITKLLAMIEHDEVKYVTHQSLPSLTCIGDSHTLSPANRIFAWMDREVAASSKLIMGIKMHHLNLENASEVAKRYKTYFCQALSEVSDGTDILIIIGEIDCRTNEGIWAYQSKNKIKSIEEIIRKTTDGYIDFLTKQLECKDLSSITLQGIPAPGYKLDDIPDPEQQIFLEMISAVNYRIATWCKRLGWSFFDVFSATKNERMLSSKHWHVDGVHLQPGIYDSSDKFLQS